MSSRPYAPATRFVVFDLDNTLVSSPTYESVFADLCAAAGADRDGAQQFWRQSGGLPLQQQFASLCPDTDTSDLEDLFWKQAADSPTVLLPQATLTLQGLHFYGLRHFLSTGTRPDVAQRRVDDARWTFMFERVLGTDLACPKGAAHYQVMHEHTGLTAAEFAACAVCVGDGAFDMRYGTQAGLSRRIAYIPSGTSDTHKQLLAAEGTTDSIEHLFDLRDLLVPRP